MTETAPAPVQNVQTQEKPATATVALTGSISPEVTMVEKLAVIIIFGALALYSMYQNNSAAATGYASALATYFLAREGT